MICVVPSTVGLRDASFRPVVLHYMLHPVTCVGCLCVVELGERGAVSQVVLERRGRFVQVVMLGRRGEFSKMVRRTGVHMVLA